MTTAAVIRLLPPPVRQTGAPEAIERTRRDRSFPAYGETRAAARSGCAAAYAAIPAVVGEADAPQAHGGTTAYLAQHIAQEVLPRSRAVVDLRLRDHPGLTAYAAMDAAGAFRPTPAGTWA